MNDEQLNGLCRAAHHEWRKFTISEGYDPRVVPGWDEISEEWRKVTRKMVVVVAAEVVEQVAQLAEQYGVQFLELDPRVPEQLYSVMPFASKIRQEFA